MSGCSPRRAKVSASASWRLSLAVVDLQMPGLTGLELTMAIRATETTSRVPIIVATAVGGIPEVIEAGKSGVLVPAGDPDALAQAVVGLIGNAPARRAMGRAAQKRARATFSADAIVPHYEALYRRVCAAS